MVVALLAVLNSAKNKPVWGAHVAFSNVMAQLADLAEEIEACAKCQAAKDGASEEKEQALQFLGDVGYEIAAGTLAYASSTGDKFLAGKVDYSRSAIISGSAGKVIARAETILDAASEVVDSLADQQVTPTKLKKFENRIKDFRAANPKPRQATAGSNAATRRLPKLYRNVRTLLTDQLDKLAVQFKASQPAFYAEYQAARTIVEAATGRSVDDNNVVSAPNTAPASKAA